MTDRTIQWTTLRRRLAAPQIRTRLVASFALLIGGISLFIFLYFPARLKAQATRALISRTQEVAEMAAYSASPALFFGDRESAEDVITGTANSDDVAYAVILDREGRVFASFNQRAAILSDYMGAQDNGGFTGDESIYQLMTPVIFNGTQAGSLYLGVSWQSLRDDLRSSRAATGLVSFLVFAIGMAVVYLISTLLTAPLSRMVDVAAHIGAGDLTQRVSIDSRDELGRLAQAFNSMVDSLQRAQADVEEQNRRLEARVHERTGKPRLQMAEKQRAEQALEQQRAFLRQIIDTDPNFVFAKDREGRFTLVNKAVADAYGTTIEGLIGKTDADFNPNQAEVEWFRRDDLEVMDSGKEKLIPEEVITDSAGHVRWLQTIKRPLRSADGSIKQVLGVATDITARKLAEDALRASEEQLRQAIKMEAVGRLAGGVAHDFNNLLSVIMGHSELLMHRLGPDHPLIAQLREIDSSAQRASALTRQLLVFSRRQVAEPKVIDLNACVENMDRMLRRLIGENIELATIREDHLGCIRADPGQIEQVIMNLVVNARDAMPDFGLITIHTANVTVDASSGGGHPRVPDGSYVELAVSDTGRGIDESVLGHIFEPFFTTKDPGKGTGLGLSIVYGIVRQSGGYIEVDSALGRGTTFTILFPRAAGGADRLVEQALHVPAEAGRGTVLLVEDEDGVRDLVRETLSLSGYTVMTAVNGHAGLDMVAGRDKPFDLIITDVVMPGMGGPELVKAVLQTHPETPVIYMSGYADDDVIRDAIREPGHLHLQKPFRLNALTEAVQAALEKCRTTVTAVS